MKENCYTLKKARSILYPAETIKDADYVDDLALLANTLAQKEYLLHSLNQAAGSMEIPVLANQQYLM